MQQKVLTIFLLHNSRMVYSFKNRDAIRSHLFKFFAGDYVDMVKSGIIDPLKVIRTALVDAAR